MHTSSRTDCGNSIVIFWGYCSRRALPLSSPTSWKIQWKTPPPDLIDRCQPRAGSIDPPPVFGLSSVEICTQTSMAILTGGKLFR